MPKNKQRTFLSKKNMRCLMFTDLFPHLYLQLRVSEANHVVACRHGESCHVFRRTGLAECLRLIADGFVRSDADGIGW